MRINTLLTSLLVSVALGFACGCSDEPNSGTKPDNGTKPITHPTAERYELFELLNPNDIPYRIPSLAVTPSGRLIAVADYRHSGTDIGVTN